MIEQRRRHRRSIKRGAIALAAVLLVAVWYVGTNLVLQWLDGRGALPKPLRSTAKSVCEPLDAFCETDLPGAEWLRWERASWHLRGYEARPDSGGLGG